MEAAGYYELLVPLYQTIRRHTPQESSLVIKFVLDRIALCYAPREGKKGGWGRVSFVMDELCHLSKKIRICVHFECYICEYKMLSATVQNYGHIAQLGK